MSDNIHFSFAMLKPLKTNELSRVNAPTAPNCKKGAVACREADAHSGQTREVHGGHNKQTVALGVVPRWRESLGVPAAREG